MRNWLIYVGIGLICLMLTPFLIVDGRVTVGLILAATLLFVAAGWSWLGQRRGKYDLSLLREIHEREEIGEIEEPDEYDTVLCVGCNTVHSSRFRVCPNCGRPL